MRKALVRLAKEDRGNIAMLTAIAAPLVIGAAGLGVETAYWFHSDLQLQEAADKAAFAAGIEKRAGSSDTVIKVAATSLATKNGFSPGTLTVNYPPKSGAYKDNTKAIEVILSRNLPRYFTGIFTEAPIVDNARAVAAMEDSGDACVLALSTTASRGINISGSNTLNVTACNLMSNSTAADAVYVGGSAKVSVDCLIAVGKTDIKVGSTTLNTCSEAMTNQPKAGDPYANLTMPSATNPVKNVKKNAASQTLDPGTYDGMDLTGNVTLNPGTYVIKSKDFKVNAGAVVTGNGVTLYFDTGVGVSINGNATINLQAPTTGTYAGILMMGSKSSTGNVTINGTAGASLLTGALYFPNQDVNYLGNFSGLDGCTRVVANTVQWSGNSTIKQDCKKYGLQPIPAIQVVRLVE